jgi:hypothetical protein
MIELKILSCHPAQRYAVRQTVVAALRQLRKEYPELEVAITELKGWCKIEKYTPILCAPSLVVNEKLVCAGRFPSGQEVVGWLKSEIEEAHSVLMP